MITEEYIKSKGYTRYNPTDFDKDIVLARYQKCFRDDKGKKYFINALKIDIGNHTILNMTFKFP